MARTTMLALTALLLLGACTLADDDVESAAPVESAMAPEDEAAGGDDAFDARSEALSTSAARGAADADAEGVDPLVLPPITGPQAPERVIKEGTLSVEVEAGAFDRGFAAVIDAAARLGGTVVSSTTRTGDDDRTSGTITVRVPVDVYEELLVSVGEIGRVRARQITAQDVTTEFVDLQSRLRHLQSQERFYLELMEKAEVVGDAIAVQQHLQQVQQQMEQIQGRLQYLEARTAYSTLTVELLEPGTALAGVLPLSQGRPTLALYWERARDAFVNMVGALLVAALFVVPLVVPAAFAVVGWRALRRRPGAVA